MKKRLPKTGIIRGRTGFAEILTKGSVVKAGSVKLFYVLTSSSNPQKVGFAVSKSIRKAHIRNRIKRCLREAYRHHQREISTTREGSLQMILMYMDRGLMKTTLIRCRDIEADVVGIIRQMERK